MKVWAIQCYLATENNWIGIWVGGCEESRSKCKMVQFCASENCWWIKLRAEVAESPIMCFAIALIFSCLCNLIPFKFYLTNCWMVSFFLSASNGSVVKFTFFWAGSKAMFFASHKRFDSCFKATGVWCTKRRSSPIALSPELFSKILLCARNLTLLMHLQSMSWRMDFHYALSKYRDEAWGEL